MIRIPALVALVSLVLFSLGCTPWYAQYGFEERAELQSPDAHERLVEIVAAGGADARRAAPYLANAPAETIWPVRSQLIIHLAPECSVTSSFEEAIPITSGCRSLEDVVITIGPESIDTLRSVNPYGAAIGIAALGPDGREGVPTLIRGLSHLAVPVRLQSIEALSLVGVADQSALDALTILERSDENHDVRDTARRVHLELLSMRSSEGDR